MGRKLNLSHLSESECEHILDVVHKDFNIRYMEKERLRRIEEDVEEEETKYSILSKSRIFNEKHCICCFSRFLLLFNPRILCDVCKFHVCKNCVIVHVDQETKSRCCKTCLKHRQLKKQSNEWFYSSVEKKFKRCGSAKVIRSIYKRRLIDDGSRSMVVMMTQSDSDSATVTNPWHSIDDDAGDNARQRRRYGATLPKSFTMATDDAATECGVDGRGFPGSASPGVKGQGHSGYDEKGHRSRHRISSRGAEEGGGCREDGRWMEEESSVEEEEERGGRAAADEFSSRLAAELNREDLSRVDSCIQTEVVSDLAEMGTMTVGEDASKCFTGFDGMSTVSTEGHETDPQFVVRPYNIRVLQGEPLIVECTVNGSEPLDVLWFCNRNQVQQLEEDDRCEIRRHGNNAFSLTLFEMRPSDSLEYLCIAVNAVGQCAQGFSVTVDANTHAQRSPEFTSPSDCVEIVPEGGQAVLRCSVSAYPEPKVTWYKNNKKLTQGGRYHTERHVPSALQYSLLIDAVRSDDSGLYCAVASNIAGQSRISLQLLVQPSVSEKRTGSDDAFSPASLHSNEDDLMRLAKGLSQTQGRYTTTATRMLRSADTMSSMQSQLDEMDRALQGLEGEVLDVISDDEDDDEDSANNNNCRLLLDDLDDMKSSAEAVGMVTSAALQLLSSAKEIAMETLHGDGETECQGEAEGEGNSNEEKEQKEEEKEDEEEEEEKEEEEEEEEVEEEEECVDAGDLELSYQELEKLYEVGLISKSQLRNRLIRKRNIKHIRSFLQSTMSGALRDSPGHAHSAAVDQSESSSIMDTSIDSLEARDENLSKKRIKNRIDKKSGDGDIRSRTSLVAAAATGDVEEVDKQLLKRTEQQIYLTSGKVFSLEDCIRDLEQEILKVDEDTPAEILASLENSVAKAVAQVTRSDHEVNDIERQVAQWMKNSNKNTRRCSGKSNQDQRLQQQLKSVVRNQAASDSETETKTGDIRRDDRN